MKKEVILVPKDKCPLDVLAEMGEQTKSSWIFMHRTAVEKLISIVDDQRIRRNIGVQQLHWNVTDSLWIEFQPDKVWLKVYNIDADNIAFNMPADDPDNILFIKMDE